MRKKLLVYRAYSESNSVFYDLFGVWSITYNINPGDWAGQSPTSST